MAKAERSTPQVSPKTQGRDNRDIPKPWTGDKVGPEGPAAEQASPSGDAWAHTTSSGGDWAEHDHAMDEAARHASYTGGKSSAPQPFNPKGR